MYTIFIWQGVLYEDYLRKTVGFETHGRIIAALGKQNQRVSRAA
jgi:hypothetical protein